MPALPVIRYSTNHENDLPKQYGLGADLLKEPDRCPVLFICIKLVLGVTK